MNDDHLDASTRSGADFSSGGGQEGDSPRTEATAILKQRVAELEGELARTRDQLASAERLAVSEAAGNTSALDITAQWQPSGLSPPASERAGSEGLLRRVENRFGLVPSIFRTAEQSSVVSEALFEQARACYLDLPLPPMFKERLFTYLSRYCQAPYCVARHCGFLLGRGNIAGSWQMSAQRTEEVIAVLAGPDPDASRIVELESQTDHGENDFAWPSAGTSSEQAMFAVAAAVFLEPGSNAETLKRLRNVLGGNRFHELMLLLAFIRTMHFWSLIHPDLQWESDIQALCVEQEELAEALSRMPVEFGNRPLPAQESELPTQQQWRQRAAELMEQNESLLQSISESRAQSEQWARIENLLRTCFDGTTDAVYIKELDGRYRMINLAGAEMLGRAVEEVQGTYDRELFPAPAVEMIEQSDRRVLTEGKRLTYEESVAMPGGLLRHFLTTKGPFYEVSGELAGLFGVSRDITEIKQTESALRISEERTRLAMKAANLGYWDWDLENDRMTWVNAKRLFGRQPDFPMATYAQLNDSIHPDDRANVRSRLDAAIAAGENYQMEFRVVWPDDSIRWLAGKGEVFRGPDGKPNRILGVNWDITERKSWETDLAAREAHHRRIIDNMLGYVAVVDPDGTLLEVNAAALKIAELDRSDVIGRKFWECFWWDDDEVSAQIREDVQLASRGQTVRRDARARVRSGDWIDIDFMIVPVYDELGKVSFLIPSGIDITERKRAEQALRESEQQLRRATIDAPHPMIIHAEDGEILSVNRAWTELSGYTREDIPTIRAWTKKAYGKARDQVQAEIDRLFRLSSRINEGEYRVRTRSGERRVWSFSSAPLGRLPDGRRIVISMAVDVSEQKEAAKTTARLATIVQTSEDAIFSETLDGVIRSWNRGAEHIYGYTAEEAIGRSVDMLVPPDRRGEVKEILSLVREGKALESFETQRICKDGKTLDVSLTVSPIPNADGEVTLSSVIARDITKRKRLEQKLQQLNAELEQRVEERTEALSRRNEELDQFAYVASHDLKAPLRAIDNLATWIEEDAAEMLPEASREHLRDLLGRVQRMQKLLDDLLEYARIDRISRAVKQIDVAALVDQIVQTSTPPRGFEVLCRCEFGQLLTAQAPLELVIRNLIENAIKHHDRDQGRVVVSCQRDEQDLFIFSVCDDGPGIAEEHRAKVFKIFETLRPRDEVEGSGMGLALVKKTVDRHGGRVWIRSPADGRGTCVHFTWRGGLESTDGS